MTTSKPHASTPAPASAWNLNRLLVVASAATVIVAILAFSGWSLAAFVKNLPQAIPAAPGVVFAIVLVFYSRPWVYLTAGLLNSVMPLMVLFVFGAIGTIGDPIVGSEYQSLMLLLLALVLALWGGIAGFVQGRRNAHTPIAGAMSTPTGMGTTIIAVFLVGVMVTSGMASSAVKEMAASGGSYNVLPDEAITLTTANFVFEPRTLEIPVGKIVELTIVNADSGSHTFTYEAGGKTFDTLLAGSSTTKVLLRFDAPQEIHFWCKPHSGGKGDTSEDSMVGTMIVA